MTGTASADIDLTAVTVAIENGQAQVTFHAAGPAVSDDLTRSWVWRAWTPGGSEPLLTVFVHGGIGATPMAAAIYACPGTGFCTTKADNATFTRTATAATLTLGRATTRQLPGRFRWAAAAYARTHGTASTGWEDQSPDGGLNADLTAGHDFPSGTQ